MLKYKMDVLAELSKKGYSTYKIRKDNILGQSTIVDIKSGKVVSAKVLDTICRLLHCQPGDLIEYIEEE